MLVDHDIFPLSLYVIICGAMIHIVYIDAGFEI